MARFGRSFPLHVIDKPANLGPVYFDNVSNSIYEAALSTYNWSHTVGTNSNRAIFLNVAIFASGTVSSATLGGQSFSFVRADSNSIYRSELWQLIAPTAGAGTITVNLSGSLTSIAGASSYWNVDQTAPLSANAGANGTNTPASGAITPGSANNRIFGGLATQTASNVSDQIGQALRYRNQGALGTNSTAEIGTIIGLTATTMQWNGLGALDSWAVSLGAIQPPQPVAGPTTVGSTLLLLGVG